jgi:hypothetical protein
MMVEKATDKDKDKDNKKDKGSCSKVIDGSKSINTVANNSATNIVHRDIYKREQRLRYWINRVRVLSYVVFDRLT